MSASNPADVTAPNQLKRMMLAAIGVVYGDIGTSPLYTLRECLGGAHGLPVVRETVLGLVSLILWALIVVVTIKYVLFIMRIDNRGEGGILALMALAQRKGAGGSLFVTAVGLIGAALFFGDGIITPAISVLSAVEGLEVATPAFKPYVIPVALAVLAVLFALQYRGTDKVGGYFGPVMLVWFATLGGLGLVQLIQRPEVLLAFDPRYAAAFFADNGFLGFLALGAVILAVTGGEALYADMGHFGVRPVRLAWMTFVLPALALNYLGQGALVLGDPAAAAHPFYHLAPEWLLLPLVGLATAATIIASQAVISGAFSLTQQAIQLGFCPRMEIRHTSEHQIGQIYMPEVNERLFIGVVALVIIFQSSSNLAAAYGIAVAGTMTATTLLAFIVVRHVWGWRLITCLAVIGPLLLVDLAFLGANAWKVFDGGWVPLALAGLLVMMMTTWRHGRKVLAERLREETIPIALFLERLDRKAPPQVTGTAVYMTRHTEELPNALLHNLKHNKVLHQRVVLLTVQTLQIPRVPAAERLTLETPRANFHHLFLRCGFMETPDIPQALQECSRFGLDFPMIETSFFLGRETLIPAVHPPMSRWRERLFILLSKNAVSATDFFRIPADRVIELGAQVPV
jgi:KUP system potassium uptake protein